MKPIILYIFSLLSKWTSASRLGRLPCVAFVASTQSIVKRQRRVTCDSASSNDGILGSCRPTNGHETRSLNMEVYSNPPLHLNRSSHIVSITSRNIAGMRNEDNNQIVVNLIPNEDESPTTTSGLIAITGESGSGKSVLVSKAIDLVTGGKAVATLLPPAGIDMGESSESSVEMVVNLFEPHLSAISASLKSFGVDPNILYTESSIDSPTMGRLHLSRIIQHGDANGRMKSACRINGRHVSLKTLRAVSSPLFTRVDVSTASAALSRPNSRLEMIDTGVSGVLRRECIGCRDEYLRAKTRRRRIQKELEERVLPMGMQRGGAIGSEEEVELLKHWVDELDMFESRINTFREAVLGEYNEILLDSGPNNNNLGRSSNLMSVLQSIRANTWASTDKSDDESLFANLLEFREEVKAVETKLASAQSAYEILSSMTAPDSAAVALEKVRKILYSISKENCGQLFDSIEKTHDLLNNVEESLNACARTIDGKSNSVIATLEKMVCTGISLEQIDNIVGDWNALARKHGISPYSLPKCHESLRQELDGNDEAAILLQEAEEDERIALKVYSDVCREISERRKEVAAGLSESVTKLLPSLGLEGTTFQVQMRLDDGGFENPRCSTDTIGVDTADFLLLHQKSVNGERDKLESTHGGYIDQVGSSGEKSRVLLAIETSLPGSIGTACNSHGAGSESVQNMETAPISIVYDEIDAHVGGRAAVTMARLLANQTRRQPASCDAIASRGSQIVAITHSASLAALADHHIVIERSTPRELESSTLVKAYSVDGPSRRKEIARMASGDMAMTEAEQFADALIRDALLQRDLA